MQEEFELNSAKNSLRGCLIRQIRTQHRLSLENLAGDTGMNTSILCDMELGRRRISDQNIQTILKSVNVDFTLVDDQTVSSLIETILLYFKNFYYMNFDLNVAIEEQYQKLIDENQECLDDRYFYLLLLGCFITISYESVVSRTGWEDPDLDSKLQLLQTADSHFPAPLDSISKLICLLHAIEQCDFKRAHSLIGQIQTDYSDPISCQVTNLVKYQDLRLANLEGDPPRAYQLIPLVRNELVKDKNYRRMFNLDKAEAVYLMTIGNYTQAEQNLSNLQSTLKSLHLTIHRYSILDNRIWCTLVTRRYEECLDLIEQCESEYSVPSSSNTVFKAYCQYRLDPEADHKLQEEELLAFRKRCDDDKNAQKIVDILFELVKGRKKTFFSKCLSFIHQLIRQQNYPLAEFFIQAGFDEAESQNQFEMMYQFKKIRLAIEKKSL